MIFCLAILIFLLGEEKTVKLTKHDRYLKKAKFQHLLNKLILWKVVIKKNSISFLYAPLFAGERPRGGGQPTLHPFINYVPPQLPSLCQLISVKFNDPFPFTIYLQYTHKTYTHTHTHTVPYFNSPPPPIYWRPGPGAPGGSIYMFTKFWGVSKIFL